jgi:hypothetical protein
MDFLLEQNTPEISFQFQGKKHKQKLLVHAILKCSKITLEGIAAIINVPRDLILNVYNGSEYLTPEKNAQLIELFIICFTD